MSSPEENGKIDRSANILAGKRNLLCGHMKVYFIRFIPLVLSEHRLKMTGWRHHRILKVLDWTDHIKKLGANAIYFSPVFESDTHGYNTRDYRKIDCRLGSNEDFKQVCDKLHSEGIRVVLDGVFNHAGRGFWAFQDVLKNRENSPYLNWFHINLGGNSNYNDGLWYEGWEGNYDLVKLNLQNEEVVQYLLESVRGWVDEFDIDGRGWMSLIVWTKISSAV